MKTLVDLQEARKFNTETIQRYSKQQTWDLEVGTKDDESIGGRPMSNLDEIEFADLISVVSEAGKQRI